jgi:sugar lactone lactonase YvrE
VPAWARERRIHFFTDAQAPPSAGPAPAGSPLGEASGGAAAAPAQASANATAARLHGAPLRSVGRNGGPPAGHGVGAATLGRRCQPGYCPGVPLRYYEGKVQTEPSVHVVFWGSNWNGTAAKELREQYLLKLYSGLANSAYQGILTQYFQPNGSALQYITQHVSVESFIDERETAPGGTTSTEVNDERIQAEAHYAVEHQHWARGLNSQFVVVPAPGSKYESKFLGGFCAYHGDVSESGTTSTYTFVPDAVEEPFRANCIGYDENANGNRVTSMLASHEYSETVTDPLLNAWRDTEGFEIGDICSHVPGTNELPDGAWVQGEWANDQNACSLADEHPLHLLAVTDTPSEVSAHEATLRGEINPQGAEATYHFEYGPTTSYGTSVPSGGASAGSGIANKSVSAKISGLSLETTYHYRVVATSVNGTAFGEDQTFVPSQWSIANLNQPPEVSGNVELTGVSCVSSQWCMAAGWHGSPHGQSPYSQLFTGKTWSVRNLPVPGEANQTSSPTDVAVDSHGNIWVTDRGHNRVDEFAANNGELIRTVGSEGTGNGQFKGPWGIAFAPNGNVWVTDSENNRVEEFTPTGGYVRQMGSAGSGEGQFSGPLGVAVDSGEHVWVTDSANNRVEEFSSTGSFIKQVGSYGTGNGQFHVPTGIAVASSGKIWVSDSGNSRVEQLSSSGEYLSQFATTAPEPEGIGVDSQEHLWVVDGQNVGRVQEFSSTGTFVTSYGAGGGCNGGEFYYPWGIALSGNTQYVADWPCNEVEAWVSSGETTPKFSTTYGVPSPETAMSSVSCTTTTSCTAVGFTVPMHAAAPVPLAERWNGTGWTLQSVPAPSGAKSTVLSGVSCTSASECIAVGASENASGVTVPYAARWSGGTWSEQSMPTVSEGGTITALLAVSCTEAAFCMAVGRTKGETGVVASGREFAERWNGSAWAITPVTSLSGTDKAELTGVSCTSSTMCIADGPSLAPHPNHGEVYWGAVLQKWNGSEWSGESAQATPSQFQGGPSSISCVSAESCVAAGGYEITQGHWVSLIEQWNGKAWVSQRNGAEGLPMNNGFDAVSCVGESICAAVGNSAEFYASQLAAIRQTAPFTYNSSIGSEGTGNGQLREPGGVALDAHNNIWVADNGNNRIQEFNATGGYVRQFGSEGTGNGQFKHPGDVAVAPNGNLWVADAGNCRVQEFTSEGAYIRQFGTCGTGEGQFVEPGRLAVAANGNVWVTDPRYYRVEEFSSEGAFIKQVSPPTGTYPNPGGIAIAPNGKIWITDIRNAEVAELSSSGEFITKFGSEGNGNGQFYQPVAISVDANGNLWVDDYSGFGRVQEFTPAGEFMGHFSAPGFYYPDGIAAVGGWVYLANRGSGAAIQKWRVGAPSFSSAFGAAGSGNGQLSGALGDAVDANGNVWVADSANNRVQEFSSNGEFLSKFGTEGTGNGQFKHPGGVALTTGGNLWVTDAENSRVEEFTASGAYLAKFTSQGGQPGAIAIAPNGDIWVGVWGYNRIDEYSASGEHLRQINTRVGPSGLAVDANGNVWVTAIDSDVVQEFSESGTELRKIGKEGGGSGNGEFVWPTGIAVDAAGNVWVGDGLNARVQEFNSNGEYLAQFGTYGGGAGQLNYPQGVAVAGGWVYVVDGGNNRMQKWAVVE